MAPSSHVSLNGPDLSRTVDVNARIAIKLDVGYALATTALASGRHTDLLSYLIGPTVYPLVPSRITGPVPLATGT